MLQHRHASVPIRPGTLLILLYVLVAYLVPALLVSLNGTPEIYREVPLNKYALGILILSFVAYLFLGNIRSHPNRPSRQPYDFRFITSDVQILILGLLAAAAAYGYVAGFSGFRYNEEPLSTRDSSLLLLFALIPTVLQFFLLIYLFYDPKYFKSHAPGAQLKKVLLLGGLFLSANGTAVMLIATLAAASVLFPRAFETLLFRSTNSTRPLGASGLKRRTRMFVLVGTLAFAAVGAWILGEATKRGQLQSVLELVSSEGVSQWAFNWLVSRLSPSYISLVAALDHYALASEWRVISDHLMAPITSFLFRADYLLMNVFDIARPENGSIARINYLMIEANPINLRSGTSAGLIAGFLYSFPFPFNFFVLIGYLLFVQQFLSRLIAGLKGQLTAVGWLIFLIFMLPLFANPIDLLLIIDNGTVAFVLLIVLRQVLIKSAPSDTRSSLTSVTAEKL